jgi:hypothetical protein
MIVVVSASCGCSDYASKFKKPKKAQKKLKIDVKTAQMGSKTGFLALTISAS